MKIHNKGSRYLYYLLIERAYLYLIALRGKGICFLFCCCSYFLVWLAAMVIWRRCSLSSEASQPPTVIYGFEFLKERYLKFGAVKLLKEVVS
jgi:hypothetical protein